MDFRTTLLFERYGGVCGCPQIWDQLSPDSAKSAMVQRLCNKHENTNTADLPSRQQLARNQRLPSTALSPTTPHQTGSPTDTNSSHTISLPSPSDPRSLSPAPTNSEVKVTCFWWYHGEKCGLRSKCDRAHKVHTTWPITPPPGFVHRIPCNLPLCPVSDNMAALLQENEGNPEVHQQLSVEEQVEEDLREIEKEVLMELGETTEPKVYQVNRDSVEQIDGFTLRKSEVLESDSSSESSPDSDTETDFTTDSIEEGTTDAIALSADPDTTSSSASSLNTTSPSSPPFLDEVPHIMSISHDGTQSRKKRRATNDFDDSGRSNKRSRPRQIPREIAPRAAHALRSRPEGILGGQWAAISHPETLRRPTFRAPRAFDESPSICFHWYHKGSCKPKHMRNGRRIRCKYLHTLNTSIQRVGLPHGRNFRDHFCQLPLCPARPRMLLVDYKLPMGEDRAEWDTDELRRAFGEIE